MLTENDLGGSLIMYLVTECEIHRGCINALHLSGT